MLNLDNITIVVIDGQDDATKSFNALKYSCKDINFKKKLFLTSNPEKYDNSFCEIQKINKISYKEYSKFCLFHLHEYISTDYALMIQWDGFVLNSNLWDKEFLKYDYVGAPWTASNVIATCFSNTFLHKAFIENNILYQVGNGGFSLRSKKLLKATAELYKDFYENYPEDVIIGIVLRQQLEKRGLVFPDVETAAKFSCEENSVNNIKLSTNSSFGFHGKTQHPHLLSLPSEYVKMI